MGSCDNTPVLKSEESVIKFVRTRLVNLVRLGGEHMTDRFNT